jgi:hypothetical protein
MAEETSTKVAPMTENGNNCPTSEQAAKIRSERNFDLLFREVKE